MAAQKMSKLETKFSNSTLKMNKRSTLQRKAESESEFSKWINLWKV